MWGGVGKQLGSDAKGDVGSAGGCCQQIEAADKQRQLVLFEGVVARLGHNYGGTARAGEEVGDRGSGRGNCFRFPLHLATPVDNLHSCQRGLAIDLAIEAKHKTRI